MTCKICKSDEYIDILKQPDTPIWVGSSGKSRESFPCNIRQCMTCGHIYEVLTDRLSEELRNIYQSQFAYASTPPNKGNWGSARAKFFLGRLDYKNYDSAIEIGCADGYFLKFLEGVGYKKLIGVEPSIKCNEKIGNIEFIKTFIDEKTSLHQSVDLIFSNAVFEHIEEINGVLQFSKKHLKADGELFFAVPNAQREVETGDPALFIHEHVHYYTVESIENVLAINGFVIKSIVQECDAIYVSAILDGNVVTPLKTIKLYNNYTNLLNARIDKFHQAINSNKNIVIHGANNKLNNLLAWSKLNFEYTLVDNDKTKLGKSFFDHKVHSIKDLNMLDYDGVVVIPTCFYDEICKQYVDLGFLGNIYKI
ncbi:class I SAM-dependent methyltransferase [bacterium]|jgi:SAM-dependent methyltransferase|nr:class I SAM-dependent methyltransferase [bacterium]